MGTILFQRVVQRLSVWEERKVRFYGENSNVHQSHSQNDSGDLRGVVGGDGKLECLCGMAGASCVCDGSAHSSGCVVYGSNTMAAFCRELADVPAQKFHKLKHCVLSFYQ